MYIRVLFVTVILFFSRMSLADEVCTINANKDFSVSFNINTYTSSNVYQLKFDKTGNSSPVLVWSTSNSDSPLIYENGLSNGKSYNFRINYDSSNGAFTYYKKQSNESAWQQAGTSVNQLDNGNAEIELVGGENLLCPTGKDVPVTPVALDMCQYVPDLLTSNAYTSLGVWNPSSQITITGTNNHISIPSHDYKFSFQYLTDGSFYTVDPNYPNQYQGSCFSPGENTPKLCQNDSSKQYTFLPIELDDSGFLNAGTPCSSGVNNCVLEPGTYTDLDIPEGATITFTGGEYWFNSLNFNGKGINAIFSSESYVHYKTIKFDWKTDGDTSHPVNINADGADNSLLFIGHGSNAEVRFRDGVNYINMVANFYVNESTNATGFNMENVGMKFRGRVTANTISISGSFNDISSPANCDIPDPDPTPTPDICEYFPGALQNNGYPNGSLPAASDSSTYALKVIGGDSNTGNRVYLDYNDPLPFPGSQTNDFAENNAIESGCYYTDGGAYGYDADQRDDPVNNSHSDPDLILQCSVDASLDVFNSKPPVPDSNDANFQVDDETNKVEYGPNDNTDKDPLQPGSYGSFVFNASGRTLTLEPGEYWVNTINYENNANDSFIIPSANANADNPVIIHYKKIVWNTFNRIYFNATKSQQNQVYPGSYQLDPKRLIMIGHGSESGLKFTTNDIYINALWYVSPEVTAPGYYVDTSAERVQFYGYLSAPGMYVNGGSSTYIYPKNDNNCSIPTPIDSYTIDVIPDYQFSLMCQTPGIRIEVKNEEGTEIATGYDGNVAVSVDPTDGLTLNQPTTGSLVSEGIYKPDAGVVVIPVESSSLNEYTVSATLSTDSTQTDQGVISFVPFSFDVDDQYVIANKPKNVAVKVLACDQGQEVAVNYTGTPTVSSTLEAPAGGIGALSFAPVFTTENEGTIDTSLMFSDSGKLKVTLTDERFDCTGYEGCPIGEDGEANGILQGSFYVSSRPWTFAICDANGSAMDGNITDAASQKFIAAGEEFSLYVKPLKWVTGDTDPLAGDENINVSTYCDQPITQNFALSDTATAATIILDYALAQPTPERGGVLGTLSGVTSLTNLDSSGSDSGIYYNFANLSWSEVGGLTIQADTQSNYLGMNVNMGYRNIGRFYPDHFTLEGSNLWDYSPNHNGFAYMNQPIKMNYTVKAKNRQDGDTENYGLFDASLLAAFNLEAKEKTTSFGVDVFDASLVDRVHLGSDTLVSWNKASYSFSSNDFIFLKKVEESAPYTSTTDGPFDDTNAVFGLSVDPSHSTYQNKDEVNFDKDFLATTESFVFPANNGLDDIAVSFVNQPDFRYGRMVLGNVSGPIGGPISVPLRTEYWSGSSFVTNTDDSGSKFKANIYYVMSNHADSGAKLTSTNSANEQSVSAGKSSVLKASQDTPQRETVRLFLRQGNDSDGIGNNATPVEDDELNATNEGWKNAQDMGQPWLQFNWRSKGDEDPSTVVNFGAYRGNDRVIYRGEPNLTVN